MTDQRGQQRPPNAPEPAKLDEAPPPPPRGLWPGYDHGAGLVECPPIELTSTVDTVSNRAIALDLAVQLTVARIRQGSGPTRSAAMGVIGADADNLLAWLEADSDGS